MDILMPKVGLTMTEGTITQWHKREGERVGKGELLFTFETEKSTLEYESPLEGVLARILVPVGQVTPCLAPVADIDRQSPASIPHAPVSPRARLRARELGIDIATVPASGPGGVVLERDVLACTERQSGAAARTTPVAQRAAAELGVDLAAVKGSGPGGRITREDVDRAAESRRQPPSPPPNLQALTPARRITAQRTAESARTAPHVTLTTEADATALVSAREQLIAELGEKVSYNALLVAIAARALKEHPQLNASWAEGGIALHNHIAIGVAVDTPRGLYVPVVPDASSPLVQIHRVLTELLARTLAGTAGNDDFSGGTFTITNLGMYEIDAFTPIVNQPQCAILGVGRIAGKPVARGEQVVVRQMMTLSLSFDHRVVDGAPAAQFLQRIKALIERPFALLV